jgi:hypothetical protein
VSPVSEHIGTVTDEKGSRIEVYASPGIVILGISDNPQIHLTPEIMLSDVLAEDFAQLFTAACWQAGRAVPP